MRNIHCHFPFIEAPIFNTRIFRIPATRRIRYFVIQVLSHPRLMTDLHSPVGMPISGIGQGSIANEWVPRNSKGFSPKIPQPIFEVRCGVLATRS
jgi:hypothetical protein